MKNVEIPRDGFYQLKGQNDFVLEEGFYKNGLKHGLWLEKKETYEVGHYLDGLRNGIWIAYHIPLLEIYLGDVVCNSVNGETQMFTRIEYKNGLKHGKYEEFGEENIVRLSGFYEENKKTGFWKGMLGASYIECNYINDLLNGNYLAKNHYNDEIIERTYSNDVIHGIEIVRYNNGSLKSVGYYQENDLIGDKVFYNKSNHIIKIFNKSQIILFNSRNPRLIDCLKECILRGKLYKITSFHENGFISAIENYDYEKGILDTTRFGSDGIKLYDRSRNFDRHELSLEWDDVWSYLHVGNQM